MLPVAKKIDIQDWMRDASLCRVIAALQAEDTEPQVLLVGGCVRNTLLGLPPGDIDLATLHEPPETTRRLAAAGIKTVPTGIDHGTVTAVAEGKPFEITTLRRDVQTDGRHAVIAFSRDWREDSQRRDFTMNTLLADAAGNIYDPAGRGIDDLAARRVIFVGDPARRIAEDYLRILRFFRFHALYDKGPPDPAALSACRGAADKIITLSRERITQEMMKILGTPSPADSLRIMFENNIMPDLMNSGVQLDLLSMLAGLQNRLGPAPVETRLAFLCGGHAEHLTVLEKYLVFSNAQRRTLEAILDAVRRPAGIRERLYHYGREAGGQSILLLAVLADAIISDQDLELIRNWDIPVLPLTGEDLKKIGVAEGPRMGEILREVETWWIEWDFRPDRIQCLDRARDLNR